MGSGGGVFVGEGRGGLAVGSGVLVIVGVGVGVGGNLGSQSSWPMLRILLVKQLICFTSSTVEPVSNARLNKTSPF